MLKNLQYSEKQKTDKSPYWKWLMPNTYFPYMLHQKELSNGNIKESEKWNRYNIIKDWRLLSYPK